MMGVLQKQISLFFKSFLFTRAEFFILFFKILVEKNFHNELRYSSIAFGEEKTGDMFFLFCKSPSASRINFSNVSFMRGDVEICNSSSRINCLSCAFTIALKGNPSSLANFCARSFTCLSVLILMAVFIYLKYIQWVFYCQTKFE